MRAADVGGAEVSGETRRFVVVRRHEVDIYGKMRVTMLARVAEAASAEEAASEDINDSSVVELRVIPVDDVHTVDLAAVRAWREAKWKREREEEERDELEHALEVVARHREKMAEVKQ